MSANISTTLAALSKKIDAQEYAIYAESNFSLATWSKLNFGLRTVSFGVDGVNYHATEPRLSFNALLGKDWTLKTSYNQMTQFVHLLTNNGIGISNDIWVPSTNTIPPQKAQQYSLGLFKDYTNQGLSLSIEAYNKTMNQLIDYPEGTNFLNNLEKPWQEVVSKNGIGRVYGLEVLINKSIGKLKGWISYTLSNSQRQFADINQGQWYASKYDKRHVLNITGTYDLSPKWALSST